jgi:ribonuclease T2
MLQRISKSFVLFSAVALMQINYLSAQAAPADGSLLATMSCPMFQSKAKQTNPGNIRSRVGQRYQIIEVTPSIRATKWYRVKVSGTRFPRWVEGNCGRVARATRRDPGPTNTALANSCSTPRQQDSNVLALTWQAAFCESRNDRPSECRSLRTRSYAANNFSLHGLWPNRDSCARDYGFCGAVKDKRRFCSYPSLELSPNTRSKLARVMPNSAQSSGCLQRHEYWKHGACLTTDANAYYEIAINLTDAFNRTAFVTRFMRKHVGRKVARSAIRDAFEQQFGTGSARRVRLVCADGMLSELQIQLPKSLSADTSIGSAIAQGAPVSGRDRCPPKVRIDAANR